MDHPRWTKGVLVLTVFACGGCAITRHGTLRQLPEGPIMEAVVSVEGESAFVTATDPTSGETLDGRLEPASERRQQPPTMDPLAGSAISPGPAGPSGASLMAPGPRTLHLVGELTSDRGTILHCEVSLEQRMRLGGEGICRTLGEGPEVRYILVF